MGKSDLIYCVDGTEKDANKFRYSQDQRRKETKSKKFSKLILELKQEKINGKTIIEHETELSNYNRKSLNIDEFKAYIQKKFGTPETVIIAVIYTLSNGRMSDNFLFLGIICPIFLFGRCKTTN